MLHQSKIPATIAAALLERLAAGIRAGRVVIDDTASSDRDGPVEADHCERWVLEVMRKQMPKDQQESGWSLG